MIGIPRDRAVTGRTGGTSRYAARWAAHAALIASATVVLASCGGVARSRSVASGGGVPNGAAPAAVTDAIHVIGKVDAEMGAMGTFTGKSGWPAMSPSDIHVRAGATVVLTIDEYDDMVTPLADQSPFLQVMGGTETVNGKPVTAVSNKTIAHTITVPSLGINIPLPVASMDKPATVRFTFRAPPAPGTYLWLCVTPCGTGPYGISGAMHTDGWMRGYLTVSSPAAASGR